MTDKTKELAALEASLQKNQFVSGHAPGAKDLQAFNQVKQLPIKPTAHSRSYAWFNLVSRFSEETRNRWGGAQVQAQASKQTESAPITKKQPKANDGKKPDPNMKKHPATVREYYEDSYMFKSSGNKVLEVLPLPDGKEGEFVVVLDKTILHPQGGGQPNDEGSLVQGDVQFKITNLPTKEGDVIWHVGTFEPAGKSFVVGSEVDCVVDEKMRRLYARIHSAGHLLDIAMTRAGRTDLKPSKGYHFPTGAYVEYIGNVEADDRPAVLKALNDNCKAIIEGTAADKPVFKKMCSYDEANKLLEKAGGVPDYIPAGQSLRVLKLVEEDFGCPCGGTHVQHVSDIAQINVTKIAKKGKSIQVKYEVATV